MIRYIIATPEEAKMLKRYAPFITDNQIDIIGKGATNLDSEKYSKEDILINIGYAGGYKIPIGTLIEPAYAMDVLTWRAEPIDRVFMIERRICLTSNRFIEYPMSDGPHLYDMELYKIAMMPHKKIHSIKIISDNLREKDFEEFDSNKPWAKVADMLKIFTSDR